jgi:hypothetical protein
LALDLALQNVHVVTMKLFSVVSFLYLKFQGPDLVILVPDLLL